MFKPNPEKICEWVGSHTAPLVLKYLREQFGASQWTGGKRLFEKEVNDFLGL